jgi:hypothetical protein
VKLDAGAGGEDGHPRRERRVRGVSRVAHNEPDPGDAGERPHLGEGIVTETASLASEELEFGRHGDQAIVAAVRPTTAAVVAGLLLLIVGAFLWQLFVSGSAP